MSTDIKIPNGIFPAIGEGVAVEHQYICEPCALSLPCPLIPCQLKMRRLTRDVRSDVLKCFVYRIYDGVELHVGFIYG